MMFSLLMSVIYLCCSCKQTVRLGGLLIFLFFLAIRLILKLSYCTTIPCVFVTKRGQNPVGPTVNPAAVQLQKLREEE